MKNILKYLSIALITTGGMVSCNLDKEVDLSLSADNVFSKYENTRGFLANIYTYLPDAFAGYTNGQFLAASRDCMTDNSLSYWNVHYYHSVLNDAYNAKNHYFAETYWTNDFKGIRACNQFLANAKASVVGNSEKTGDDNHLYDRWMAEARFLRAIFHFDLASYFGAVPIEGDDANGNPIVYDPGDQGSMNIARTSAAETYKWVADQCDYIINNYITPGYLPFRYADETSNWGRINGAAVYALKSRALLYRASPLNNTSGNTSWWKEAAQAALDFINVNESSSNPYKLYSTGDTQNDYYNCFISTPHLNPEYILCRSEWTTYDIELYLAPCGFSGKVNSVGRTNPTQNLVDAYETINGLPIDQDPTYDPQNPYVNRDPRLEQTILHQGSWWGDATQDEYRQVDVAYSPQGADYQELHGGTTTGYYTKKFLNNMSFKSPTTYTHGCPIFRYAEILLNAAEALNESGQTEDAYQYVNKVRDRVGMPNYSGMTQSQLRERLQNERRVELCFEDHRFFDERRWKLFEGKNAKSETSLPRYQQVYNIYSAQIKLDDNGNPSYSYVNDNSHPTRIFNSPKNYLFPIPYDDFMACPNLGQNAGWEMSSDDEE